MSYGAVLAPWWDDKPVAIVGWGPSVAGLDLERLAGRFHVLAVKGAIFRLPFADAGFGLDVPRYDEWENLLVKVGYSIYWAIPRVSGRRLPVPPPNVTFLLRVDGHDLSDVDRDPRIVFSGGTSGFGALNFAVLKRARQILLFGFDYCPSGDTWRASDARYDRPRKQDEKTWLVWAREFSHLVPELKTRGIAVINASSASAITAFPIIRPEEAIALGDAAFEHLDRVRQPAV